MSTDHWLVNYWLVEIQLAEIWLIDFYWSLIGQVRQISSSNHNCGRLSYEALQAKLPWSIGLRRLSIIRGDNGSHSRINQNLRRLAATVAATGMSSRLPTADHPTTAAAGSNHRTVRWMINQSACVIFHAPLATKNSCCSLVQVKRKITHSRSEDLVGVIRAAGRRVSQHYDYYYYYSAESAWVSLDWLIRTCVVVGGSGGLITKRGKSPQSPEEEEEKVREGERERITAMFRSRRLSDGDKVRLVNLLGGKGGGGVERSLPERRRRWPEMSGG